MKANELMIGDLVIVNTYPEKVKLIGETLIKVWNRDNSIDVDDVSPIPLNADIVNQIHCHPKMAIFWDDRRTKETGENWYELRICTDGDTALNMEIRYVHELQHALRLLGIEKEIEL